MSLLSRLNSSLLSADAISQYESLLAGASKKASQSSNNTQTPEPEQNAAVVSEQSAAIVTLSSNGDVSNLEKHINDYESGKGNLSNSYYGTLAKRRAETSGLLASSNPEASSLYSAYATIRLDYGQDARFTTTSNQTARQSAELQTIAERLEEARKQ